ncbi:DUF4956 domain-containing protein [Salinicoccus sp. ID82-1]|uniref:DUF4956 domain-containing protein n=1 Tax=Salinicoccus cyprini TaxID=2493691 RepID=A0A558AX69_9STAP|nr:MULTISPECIES: DUF4956 domain-containing protein [Salinicoccus]MCG1009973.1 DUF4956 domain-containing protein [Salinicoccus sp. ID82-1]TVT28855.1 DUF4956 domain-containing protein [Salinicoccus cyprini]
MREFIQNYLELGNETTTFTIVELMIAILLSFILSIIVTLVYKWTHHGVRYSQSYVQTVVIMSVVVAIIMIVIGNNIAVAFGLVGAFSIIRFRSAMSDPKDIAFIFFGMAVGISCGLGFYVLAVLFTFTMSALILIMHTVNYGSKGTDEKVLKVTVPENMNFEGVFDDVFEQFLDQAQLVNIETTNLGTMYLLEYRVRTKKNVPDKELMDAIRVKNANMKVTLNVSSLSY